MDNSLKNKCSTCPSKDQGIFCNLSDSETELVSETKVSNTYRKGEILFSQGNHPAGIFCVNQGNIKLTKTGDDGKETIVRIVQPGDVIGHRSLFTDQDFNGTATAMEETKVCFINKSTILKFLQTKPSVALELINKLSRDMGIAEEKSSIFHQKNVRERIAQLIIDLGESHGSHRGDGSIEIQLKLTREEMATMIGTASETLIRIISEYRKDGIIDQNGKLIVIKDKEELSKRASGQI